MAQATSQTVRLRADETSRSPVLDVNVNGTPQAWARAATSFEVGLAAGGALVDVSNLASVTLEASSYASRDGARVLSRTVALGSLDNTTTEDTWADGTKEHAVFTFSSAEMNVLGIGTNATDFWIVISALTTAGAPIVFATGKLTVNDPGTFFTASTPPVNPGAYITLDQADARYLEGASDINAALSTVVRDYALEAVAGIDPLLAGKAPGATTQAIYNSDGTRNSSAWFALYAKYLTCVGRATALSNWHVVAVTPGSVVSNGHVGNLAGATVTFIPADGTAPVTRVLGAQTFVAGDLVSYPLDSLLPANIVPAMILPVSLPAGITLTDCPVMYERQDGRCYVGEVAGLRSSAINGVRYSFIASAVASQRVPWTFSGTVQPNPSNHQPGPAITGDSTRPVFVIQGGRPVLAFCFTTGDQPQASGPDVGANAVALQAAIGSAYPLSVAVLPTGPAGAVASVNGQAGAVTITAAGLGADTPAARDTAIAQAIGALPAPVDTSAAPLQPFSSFLRYGHRLALTNSNNDGVTLDFSSCNLTYISPADVAAWIIAASNQVAASYGGFQISILLSNNALTNTQGILDAIAALLPDPSQPPTGSEWYGAFHIDLSGGTNASVATIGAHQAATISIQLPTPTPAHAGLAYSIAPTGAGVSTVTYDATIALGASTTDGNGATIIGVQDSPSMVNAVSTLNNLIGNLISVFANDSGIGGGLADDGSYSGTDTYDGDYPITATGPAIVSSNPGVVGGANTAIATLTAYNGSTVLTN